MRRRPLVLAVVTASVFALGAVAAPPTSATSGPVPNVEDFEGNAQITTGNPGIFPFGGDSGSTPAISIVGAADLPGAASDNHALDVPYHVTSYGGFSDDLSSTQDWSPYGAFTFWVKGTGSGQRVEYEIKDGGPDAEHSELWQAFFTDSSTDWRQIVTPFSNFVYRTDYQPDGPKNHTLDLTSMWGFAVNLPGNASGDLHFDDFAVAPAPPTVRTSAASYLVNPGHTAHIPLTLTTEKGGPTTADASIAWSLGGGTATAGTDYTDASGTVDFPVGTPSGTTKTITVHTLPNSSPSTSKSIPVKLTPSGAILSGPSPQVIINAHGFAYQNRSLPVAQRVRDLMRRMDLAAKIGQMTQAERAAVGDGTDIAKYELGSLLSGGGSVPTPNTPQAWANMIDGYQREALSTPLQIPMIYGIDSVHGDNNLAGATLFPHNVGMGATHDPALAYKEGHIAATETRATGIPWAFSPCVCVARDDRWGRAYESYSEDPALVQKMETVIDGFQGDNHLARPTSVLATAKHFLGDGGTRYGSSTNGTYTIDQGITYVTRKQLNQLFVPPYRTAIAHHVGSVMPSYSSLKILGKDSAPIKMHARKDMITGLLKNKLGFKGFVISDYAAIDQISPDYKSDVKTGINAGLDMIMVPNNYTTFISDLTDLVHSGDVPMSRINDAVRRILTKKFQLGLFDHPFANRSNIDTIGSAAHRAVARRAAAESQVLLKNAHGMLPLQRNAKIYVAGSNADDAGNQSGGWTLSWQGQSGAVPGATTILAGMREDAPHATITYSADASAPTSGYKFGVVVVGEKPYAEGVGDIGNGHTLQLSVADRNAVDTVCGAMKCAVLVVSGRPLDITGVVPEADAVVASWLPGSEGEGVADVLFGRTPFTGRLPVSWFRAESQIPINVGDKVYRPLYPFGWGLQTGVRANRNLANLATAVHRARAAHTWAQRNRVVTNVRDVVEQVIVKHHAITRTATLTADAEHQLLTGHPVRAVRLLLAAGNRARH